MENHIYTFFHCAKCISELPIGKSPREYSKLEVGFTKAGIQVWCQRHEENVIHLDFLGQKVTYYNEVTHRDTNQEDSTNPEEN